MTPEDAEALGAIIEGINDAGGQVRETDIDHENVGGLASAMNQMLGGNAQIRPVFTLEITADPDEVLVDDDRDVNAADAEDIGAVTLDPELAEVCLRELQILVSQTDHPTDEYGDAMTPLARAQKRIEDLDGEGIDHFTIQSVLQTIEGVADQTGAESNPIDPLQDDIFRAIHSLQDELGVEDADDEDTEQVEISFGGEE
jgi:hypothetical protein